MNLHMQPRIIRKVMLFWWLSGFPPAAEVWEAL